MTGWRERGYVPDSDEDEDELVEEATTLTKANDKQCAEQDVSSTQLTPLPTSSIETNDPIHHPPSSLILGTAPLLRSPLNTDNANAKIQSPATALLSKQRIEDHSHRSDAVDEGVTTAERLEDELRRGLEACHDVLGRSSPPPRSEATDSPLSSLPSSPALSPWLSPTLPVVHPLSDNVDVSPGLLPSPADRQPGPIRSFRQRNPLQLHPYSLEAAKYQMEWQQRGLRPVRLPPSHESQLAAKVRTADNSQSVTLTSSQEPRSVSTSSPVRLPRDNDESKSQSPIRGTRPTYSSPIEETTTWENVDELPDLKDIFGATSFGTLSAQKRPTPSVDIPRRRRSSPLGQRRTNNSESIFDLPPSPPQPQGRSSTAGPSPSIREQAKSSGALLTPLLFSSRRKKRMIVDVSSSAEDSSDDVDAPLDVRSDREEPKSFLHIRKKIKGVLPASWIKLDARQQTARPPGTQAAVRSPEKRLAKGVARHVSPRTRASSQRPSIPLAFSSGEESDESQHAAQAKEARPIALDALFDGDADTLMIDDVMEEDVVDPMLPRAQRSSNDKPRKKRQKRLSDSWLANRQPRRSRALPGTVPATREEIRHRDPARSKRKQKTRRPVQITILDAPGLTSLDRSEQTRFLRVAARPRRTSRRARPQNPEQKFFQLPTTEDTNEVNVELHNWRKTRSTGRNLHSADLERYTGSNNVRAGDTRTQRSRVHGMPSVQRSRDISSTIQYLKASTASTLARMNVSSAADQPVQSISHARLQPGFVSWHGNRAGSGKFWTRTVSRPTPLELPAGPAVTRGSRAVQSANEFSTLLPLEDAGVDLERRNTRVQPRPKKPAVPRRITAVSAVSSICDKSGRADTDAVSSTDHALDTGSISSHAHQALLAKAASRAAANVEQVQADTSLNISPFVNEGRLDSVLNAREDRQWYTRHSIQLQTKLWTCQSQQEMLSSCHTSQTHNFIQTILDEAVDSIASKAGSGEQERSISSLETLVDYFEQSLTFSDLDQAVRFSGQMLQDVDATLTYFQSQRAGTNPDTDMRLLTRLMALVVKVRQIPYANLNELDTAHSRVLERAATMLLRMLLGNSNLIYLKDVVDAIQDHLPDAARTLLESWIIFLHTAATFGNRPGGSINKLIGDVVDDIYGDNSLVRLALTLLLEQSFRTLGRMSASGILVPMASTVREPWQLIGPAMRPFLESYTAGELTHVHAPQLGLNAVSLCVSLAQQSSWTVPDALLQLLFKHYGKNDMLELFVAPKTSTAITRITATPTSKAKLTDYEMFLQLIATSLQQKAADLAKANYSATKQTKILGLVFSLIPNNSRTMNEQDDVENAVYMTMANTYGLYATLYGTAPRGCRPRLSHIENLLDFSTSHAQIRDLTIAAWTRMSTDAITHGSDIDELVELGDLGHSLWTALADKLYAALHGEIRPESTFHHELVVNNCSPVLIQLTDIIKTWKAVVALSSSPNDQDVFVNDVQLTSLLQFVTTVKEYLSLLAKMSSNGYQSLLSTWQKQSPDLVILELAQQLITLRSAGTTSHVFKLARDVVSGILSAEVETDARLQAMTDAWFKIAQTDVGADQSKWDKYLQAPSSSSFQLLADSSISQQCMVLFTSKVVIEAPIYFELDPETLYSCWLKSLLQPEEHLRFEHILTQRLLASSPGGLALSAIDDLVQAACHNSLGLTLETLKHIRIDMLKLIVRAIFDLQFSGPDDSQDLMEEVIDERAGRRLLTGMCDTMKKTWLRLQSTQDRATYAKLAQAVVHEMEIYTYNGFQLDPWFTDPSLSDLPIAQNRFKTLFTRRPGSEDRIIDVYLIAGFRQDIQRAANTSAQVPWTQAMAAALSCNNVFDDVDDEGRSLMDGHLQFQFIQNVLLVYVQNTFSKGPRFAVWTVPIVEVLVDVLNNLHLRQDLHEDGRITDAASLCCDLLHAVQRALDELVSSRLLREGRVMMLAIRLVELASCCVLRFQQLSAVYADIDVVEEMYEPMQRAAASVSACITDPAFDARPDLPNGVQNKLAGLEMSYISHSGMAVATPGVNSDIRDLTLTDIDSALGRGQQSRGLGHDWRHWYEGHLQTFTESRGKELQALASAVRTFILAAQEAFDLDADGQWMMWENLAVFGAHARPLDPTEDREGDDTVEMWDEHAGEGRV